MATNIGFDSYGPYVETGADEGEFVLIGDRLYVDQKAATPATIRLMVERLEGEEWILVVDSATFLAPGGGADVVRTMDWESVSFGDIAYRGTSWSADGAAATTEIIVPARSPAVWLSGGPGFSQTARLMENPVIEITASRARAQKAFAGRPLPVTVAGEALQRVVAVSASTVDRDEAVASESALVALAQAEEPLHLVRDPDGHRVFGELSPIQLPREGSDWTPDGWASAWSVNFTLTEATE